MTLDPHLDEVKKLLSDPFEQDDIEWRVQHSGQTKGGSAWVMIVPYITNRAVQQRLDDVFGIFGWEDAYKETDRGMLCGITVHLGGKTVTKWDGAETPRSLTPEEIKSGKRQTIDPIKTVLSNSEKRAAVKLGVGRYLYCFDTVFVNCTYCDNRRDLTPGNVFQTIKGHGYEWKPPTLEEWALPNVKSDSLINDIEKSNDLTVLKSSYVRAYRYAKSFAREGLVKKVIEAYNLKKSQLNNASFALDAKLIANIKTFAQHAINDEILPANNESVLKLAKTRISQNITVKCREKELDPLSILSMLEKAYQQKLNVLTRR